MAKNPNSSDVRKAIRSLAREVNHAVNEVNEQAGKLLSRGDYTAAQSLIEVAKSIAHFGDEVNSLNARWNNIRGEARTVNRAKKAETTPLWEYYQPLLKALVELGGEASRKEITQHLDGKIDGMLKEGDFATNSRGTPKWKVMVGRARKHMIQEGFLSDENLLKWTITKKGEQAAKTKEK